MQINLFTAVFFEFLNNFFPKIESSVSNVDIAFVMKYIITIVNAASINTLNSWLVGKIFIMQNRPTKTKKLFNGLNIELSLGCFFIFAIL